MRVMVKVFLAIFLLTGVTGCSGSLKSDDTPVDDLLVENGILKVGVSLQTPPIAYLNQETVTPEGFEVELAQALGETLGLEVQFVDTTEENLLPSLDAKIYDCVISSVPITQANQKKYQVTQPYGDMSMVAEQIENKEVQGEAGIFVRRSNGQLMLRLDEALSTLLTDGTVSEISNKYFGTDIT